MSAKRLCPKCGAGCDETMLICPRCGASLTSIHKPEPVKKTQGNKKNEKTRRFSAPSGEVNNASDRKGRTIRFEPSEGRTGRQAVASATGATEKQHRKFVSINNEPLNESKKASDVTTTEEKKYPVARGLSRPHMGEVEIDTPTQEEHEVTGTQTKPQMMPSVPAAPYPIVYLPAKSIDGSDVQIPYMNTPNGLVPWIAQQTIPSSPIQSSAQQETVEEENIVPFDASSIQQNAAEPDESSRQQDDNLQTESDDDPFTYDSDSEVYENEDNSAAQDGSDSEEQDNAEQYQSEEDKLDEEDDEAFQKALKVTKHKTQNDAEKDKKVSFKSRIQTKEKKTLIKNKETEQSNKPEVKTTFSGFDPNEDHYYDDRKPVYAAEKDHITKDFVLRIVGAIVIVIGLTVAMIYMV